MSNITWGLQRDTTPRLGSRLVQEGNQLHYLADRASITGKFSDAECWMKHSRTLSARWNRC
ncbi:YagBYeeUYfjZ family protein [Enterobacter cloacae]|jgi:cytoskeleton bundling-enhancing protein CbeA-like protein|nr:YagBYeeUYfjZ family protein [Enterobacter cloacae]